MKRQKITRDKLRRAARACGAIGRLYRATRGRGKDWQVAVKALASVLPA